jgi:hypothetical protein
MTPVQAARTLDYIDVWAKCTQRLLNSKGGTVAGNAPQLL